MIPTPPYTVESTQIAEGPGYLIRDANQAVICATFEQPMADFIADKFNRSNGTGAMRSPAILASWLGMFRAQLERDLGEPLRGQEMNAALLLANLCDFFGLTPVGRVIALGPATLRYVRSLEGSPLDYVAEAASIQTAEMLTKA